MTDPFDMEQWEDSAPTKDFSQSTHDKWDGKARSAGKRLAENWDTPLVDNPDQYGIDLITPDGRYGLEVEVKLGWDGPHFPWRTIHIPVRKQKFAQLNMQVEFAVFNKSLTTAIVIPASEVLNSPVVPVKNSQIPEGELFFDITVKDEYIHSIRRAI